MEKKFILRTFVLFFLLATALSCNPDQDGQPLLSHASSSIATANGDNEVQKGQKPIFKALKNLLNGKPSPMTFTFIKKGNKGKCEDPDGKCAEILTVQDNGKESKGDPVTRNLKPADWRMDGKFHIVIIGGQMFGAQLFPKKKKMTLVKWDVKELLGVITDFKVVKPLDSAMTGGPVVAVIPPSIWDWWTGVDGSCCPDCWATHRSWGLPCEADYACCFNSCGIEPGCDDDGPENPGGNPGGGGGSDGNCSGTRQVFDVKVDTGDSICEYSGEVTMVETDTGECVEVATNGIISDCVPKETGGSGGGSGGGTDDPQEFLDPFGSW